MSIILELVLCVALTGKASCDVPAFILELRPEPEHQHTHTLEASTYRGMGNDVERWRGLVEQHFEAADVERVLCLMARESGGNPNAKNPKSSARGLMQILGSLWAPHYGISLEELYDPNTNLAIARDIRDSQGWQAWSPYNAGHCR